MPGLQAVDAAWFRFVNRSLSNPLFDTVMPWFAWNNFFVPLLCVAAALLLWRGGARGRLFVLMLGLALAAGDTFVINTIKHALARPRPWIAVTDGFYLVGMGNSASMPSSHTSSWFAATVIAWIYYRKSWRIMLPLALTMGFSRIYVGAHYPSDVLAGAILGAGYAIASLWIFNVLWQRVGRAWFPLWWRHLPSLVEVELKAENSIANESPDTANISRGVRPLPSPTANPEEETLKSHWLRLGYLFIALTLIARLLYIKSGRIELSEDEAYQWVWSKHLALSYYSKPPGIAYTQWLGTHLWGDTLMGVRFFSPVMAAALSIVLLRFMARAASARLAFFLVLILHATPLLAAGAILMTIDPPLVLFWTLSILAGWRAAQADGTKRDWVWTGVWMGLASLYKYSALFLVPCWSLFFWLWPPARVHLRRAGPWLGLAMVALCLAPVIVWNAQHSWITVRHVAQNAGMDKKWQGTLRFFGDFTGGELGLLNPFFFIAAVWAAAAFWKRERRNPLWLHFFCMGTPVIAGYWAYTLHSRVHLNWIAPGVVPMFCVMALYWDSRWRTGARSVKSWLIGALAFGFTTVILLHDTALVAKIIGRDLPPRIDPLRRVSAWSETARQVGDERRKLLREGKEVFLIATHYGFAGQLSFWLPEGRAGLPDNPLVYCQTAAQPENQFYFWPGYQGFRRGQDAILIMEHDKPAPPAEVVRNEFESVTDLGMFDTLHRGRPIRRFQMYACRHLR